MEVAGSHVKDRTLRNTDIYGTFQEGVPSKKTEKNDGKKPWKGLSQKNTRSQNMGDDGPSKVSPKVGDPSIDFLL